jgi:hypothetical protein
VPGGADGRIVDQSTRGDVDEGAVANDRIRYEPHSLQRTSLPFSSPKTKKLSSPLVMSSLSRSMAATGLNAEPVAAVRGVDEGVRHRVVDSAA